MDYVIGVWVIGVAGYAVYKKLIHVHKDNVKFDDVTQHIKRFKRVKDKVTETNKIFK
jgi:hypothetical protein